MSLASSEPFFVDLFLYCTIVTIPFCRSQLHIHAQRHQGSSFTAMRRSLTLLVDGLKMFQYRYMSSERFHILLTRIAEFTACPWRAADPYVHANCTGFLISGLCEKDVLQNRESLQLHSFEVSEFFEAFFSVKFFTSLACQLDLCQFYKKKFSFGSLS
jgi:hypothetical protein